VGKFSLALSEGEEGLLFLKKEKQKDFIRLRCEAPGPPWGRPGGLAAQL
jgi:hypothetical protein